MRSLCEQLDSDKDRNLNIGEAAVILGESAFLELVGGHRTMRSALKLDADTKLHEAWLRWTETEGM